MAPRFVAGFFFVFVCFFGKTGFPLFPGKL